MNEKERREADKLGNHLNDDQGVDDGPEEDPGDEGEPWSIGFEVPLPKPESTPEEEDRQVVQRFLSDVEARAEHSEEFVMHLNHFRRLQEDEDYRDRYERLEAEEDDLEPEEYEARRRKLLEDDYLGAKESIERVRNQWDENLAELAEQAPNPPHPDVPITPIQMTLGPGDYRPRTSWEQSLDPGASWQHSVRGLLPGTIFAVVFAVGAVLLYIYASPILGIVVGILAVLNLIVAVNHWVRLLATR